MFRALLWKHWRELRVTRWFGVGLSLLIGSLVGLYHMTVYREFTLEDIRFPLLLLANFLWPLLALFCAVRTLTSDYHSGWHTFLLERPVPRWKIQCTGALAAAGSMLVIILTSLAFWHLFARRILGDEQPALLDWHLQSSYSAGVHALGIAGAAICCGALGASFARSPSRAFLLAPFLGSLVIGPIVLAGDVVRNTWHFDLHQWMWWLASTLLASGSVLSIAASTCFGELAGRGRIKRASVCLASSVVLYASIVLIGVENTSRSVMSPVVATSSGGAGQWTWRSRLMPFSGQLLDLESGEKMQLPPFALDPRWNGDGSLLAMMRIVNRDLRDPQPFNRIEFRDPEGALVGQSYESKGGESIARYIWAGDQLLAVNCSKDKGLHLVLLDPWKGEVNRSEPLSVRGESAELTSTPDGDLFRLRCSNALWEVDTSTRPLALRPLASSLATASSFHHGKYWYSWRRGLLDPNTGEFVVEVPKPRNHSSRAVSWSPDGEKIASAVGNTVQILDTKSGACLRSLIGHEEDVNSVSWSPDGTRIASSSNGETKPLRIWDARTAEELERHEVGGNVVHAEWSPDGDRLALLLPEGLSILREPSGEVLLTIPSRGKALSCAWSPDGTRIACGSSAGGRDFLQIWDAQAGKSLKTLEVSRPGWARPLWGESVQFNSPPMVNSHYVSAARSIAWHPDGSCMAVAAIDQLIRVWDLESGEILLTLSLNEKPLTHSNSRERSQVAWGPDGGRTVTVSYLSKTMIWDAESGELLQERYVPGTWRGWSPDARRMLSTTRRSLRITDWQAGQTMVIGEDVGHVYDEAYPGGDRLFWSLQHGHECSLWIAGPQEAPRSIRSWPAGLSISVGGWDHGSLLIQVYERRPGLRSYFPHLKIHERWIYNPVEDTWDDLGPPPSPDLTVLGIWVGPRTLGYVDLGYEIPKDGIERPQFFALEHLDKPGKLQVINGYLPSHASGTE